MAIRKYYKPETSSAKKHEHGNKIKKKKTRFFLKFISGVFVFVFLSGIGTFAYFASQIPNPGQFEERFIVQSTKIYDRSGKILLLEAAKDAKRTYVSLDEISPLLQQATIAAEDDDFYSHPGIDFKSFLRALAFDIIHYGENPQGGSTITQQLIKNAMLLEKNNKGEIIGPAPRTIQRKIKEVILAFEMERKYSKDKILEFYLNEIPYGSIFYGAEAASQNYFQKSAKDLTLAEAATLAGITQSPTRYLKDSESREKRKNWVLGRMLELGYAEKEEVEKAKKEKITVSAISQPKKAPYFTGEVEKQLVEMYGEKYKQMGLRVFTTIDYPLQTLAEETVSEWSSKIEKWYGGKNAALVSINPNNGNVLAMVGGRDFKESQVNIWTPSNKYGFQSPGSAFKPIVYATTFKKGYSPDTLLWDVKTVFDKKTPGWPNNYDFRQRGPVKIKESLAQSLNIPAVKALYLAGCDETINTAKSMGMIDSFNENIDDTEASLSMAIGGKSVIPLELVSAFGVFASEGIRYLPNYILKIENEKGEVIFEPETHPIKALNNDVCHQINSILSDNNLRAPAFGSKSWLYLNSSTAAKTGTAATEKGKVTDTWTIGYNRNLVTGVWVGNNDNKPMYGKISGSSSAAAIWWNFMKEATKDKDKKAFTPPKKIKTGKAILDGYLPKETVKVDKISGKLATSATPENLIEEKSFFKPHCILYWINKDDPQGEYPKNPFDDPQCKEWEAGVKIWAEKTEGEFKAPIETDDVHTKKNIPKIEVVSKNITAKEDEEKNPIPIEEREISFSIKITAPLGVKKIEIIFSENNKTLSSQESGKTEYSFTYKLKELGEKEKYIFKIIATDTAENKGETTFEILNPISESPEP